MGLHPRTSPFDVAHPEGKVHAYHQMENYLRLEISELITRGKDIYYRGEN
jgi:hypothetical protein